MDSTLDTSHFDRSPLNKFLPANIRIMSNTRDTSQSAIAPFGPLEQSPFGDNWRHVSTALSSVNLDCGENAEVGGRAVALSSNIWTCAVKVYNVLGRVCAKAKSGMCISTRTITRIRRHEDKEHKHQDQKIRRQMNLCMMVECSACMEIKQKQAKENTA